MGLDKVSRTDFQPIHRLFGKAQGGLLFSTDTTLKVLDIIEPLSGDRGLSGMIDFLKIIDLLSRDDDAVVICTDCRASSDEPDEMAEIGEIRQFIFQNYSEDISLADAAEVANLSIPSLCRYFRKNMNTTFVKYLNKIRVSAACKYLIQTDMPINSICFRVGFNNLSNFNRRFFDEKKQSPRAFRNQYKDLRVIREEGGEPSPQG